jgi:hypothetical protein
MLIHWDWCASKHPDTSQSPRLYFSLSTILMEADIRLNNLRQAYHALHEDVLSALRGVRAILVTSLLRLALRKFVTLMGIRESL